MSRTSRAAVVIGVAAAVAAPIFQAVGDIGLSASEFAAQGDGPLRVAGYAFSIWSLIYLGLLAYAARRLLKPPGKIEAVLDWPLAWASLGCGLWIFAAAANARWMSMAVILCAAIAAVAGLIRIAGQRPFGWTDRLSALWPIALLAGWLTIASAANLVTVLAAEELIAARERLTPLVVLGIAAAGAILVLLVSRIASYAAPVVWGLAGIVAAEAGDDHQLAIAAAAAAVAVSLAALWLGKAPSAALRPR